VIDVFIDTNILLYAASGAADEAPKAEVAKALLRSANFGISVQVLQEFYVNASGKLATKIPPHRLEEILRVLKLQPVAPLSADLFDAAVALSKRYQLSYWDGAIIAAAKALGATKIYSEDLAHGQTYDGIMVVNPFLRKTASYSSPSQQ
jgi:predicted nucleic acid-binding protein